MKILQVCLKYYPAIGGGNVAKMRISDEKRSGIDYPINNERLAELITEVIGKKVEDVKFCDWDEVAQQLAALYLEELN